MYDFEEEENESVSRKNKKAGQSSEKHPAAGSGTA
jgi:hypothetical protein